jgi:polysaccharide pyruvyl transferase WcaK-like protein
LKTIGLLGQGGSPNLGDIAIQDAVIAAIRRRFSDARIVLLTAIPAAASEMHGVESIHASRPPDGTPPRDSGAKRASLPQKAWSRCRACGGNVVSEARFMRESLRRLRSFDLLVVSGGGQMGDYWGGTGNHGFLIKI